MPAPFLFPPLSPLLVLYPIVATITRISTFTASANGFAIFNTYSSFNFHLWRERMTGLLRCMHRTAALHAQSGDLRVTMVTPLRPPLPACSASYTFFLTLPLLYMTCGVLVYLPTLYSALHAFFLCPHLPTVLCSACLSALHMLHWPRGTH